MLKKREQLPVVAFTLSKKKCDANADMVRNISMVTMSEQSHIVTFFNKSMAKLKGTDRELPQVSLFYFMYKRAYLEISTLVPGSNVFCIFIICGKILFLFYFGSQ